MDEDVKLSMKQSHEKWVIKMTVFGGLIVLAMIIFWAHDCNRTALDGPCNDATFDPSYYRNIQCPDRRQTLTTPPGWTWVRCTCPGKKESP